MMALNPSKYLALALIPFQVFSISVDSIPSI